MRKKLGKFVLPVAAACMLVFAIFHVVKAQQKPPRPPPPVEPARTPFGKTVAGAGIVEARTQNIAIGTALPGLVLEVYIPVDQLGRTGRPQTSNVERAPFGGSPGPRVVAGDPQDLVGKTAKKGDPLFLVDNRQLKAQLKYNEANIAAAQAQLDKLKAMPRPEEVPPSAAKAEAAQAALNLQQDLAARARKMVPTHAIAEEDYRQRTLTAAMARKQLKQAEAELALLRAGAWEFDRKIAEANKALAEAQAEQTRTDLDRALVRAPVDGKVLQVNVRPGEYVGTPPGQALIVLGAIDQKVHVRVDIDEHDIPRFRREAPARASLRGAPEVSYPLEFVRLEPYVIPKKSLTGDNTERVDTRVLQVIYALDVAGRPVYVGQQLDVFIDVGAPPTSPPESERAG